MALMEVPAANVGFEQKRDSPISCGRYLRLAVLVPGGLITPIVHAAEQKGFKQISTEMKDLATRARDGKLAKNTRVVLSRFRTSVCSG